MWCFTKCTRPLQNYCRAGHILVLNLLCCRSYLRESKSQNQFCFQVRRREKCRSSHQAERLQKEAQPEHTRMRSTEKEQQLQALLPHPGMGTARSCCTAANIRLTTPSSESFFSRTVASSSGTTLDLSIERE